MQDLIDAVRQVPAGGWAAAVSGGADSVALLSLLRQRSDLRLHVVHLNHQTRGKESDRDAQFVGDLAAAWNLSSTIAPLEQIEPALTSLPANPSARFRMLRLELYRRAIAQHALSGVLLAHHADDQAETVLQRLIRGAGPMALGGMSPRTVLGEVLVLRPLLSVRRARLRQYLASIGQTWREDASNQSSKYLRNRLRRWLAAKPELTDALICLAQQSRQLRSWVRENAPILGETFLAAELYSIPSILARESARRWLIWRGAPPAELSEHVLDRLIDMASDAASAPRQSFPGNVLVRRRRGRLST